jgi:hypothetical protein
MKDLRDQVSGARSLYEFLISVESNVQEEISTDFSEKSLNESLGRNRKYSELLQYNLLREMTLNPSSRKRIIG